MKTHPLLVKDHLDAEASLETIAETLTRIGLEVEGIEDKAASLKAFVVAHVLAAEPHPNADRLRVCTVDTGDGKPVQVVCGAPNARAGMRTVFAPPGTYVPGLDKTLAVGTIRGVESLGMLCSGAELGPARNRTESSICRMMHRRASPTPSMRSSTIPSSRST